MKKLIVSSFVILSFVAYSIYRRTTGVNDLTLSINNSNSLVSDKVNINYKDGSYLGISSDAFYGNVQVKAIVQGGKVTDVMFLDYPKDRENSLRISEVSMPILKSEAISVQNSKVDVVSGATQTSIAFMQSLQSALSKAQ